MSHKIDGSALDLVAPVLDMPGAKGQTLVDTGNLSQVLSVNELVRRGRTPAFTGGNFFGILENLHLAANEVSAVVDPYAPDALALPPYPPLVRPDVDVYILSATVVRNSGAGALTGAILFLVNATLNRGFSADQAGAEVVASDETALARWTGLDTSLSSHVATAIAGDGSSLVHINYRIRRGERLRFSSESAAAAEYRCYFRIGLFPSGLGQDIAQ